MFKQLLKSTLFSLAILCGGSVFGQAGGYGFSVSTSTYTPLGSSATAVDILADTKADTVPIGFDFYFEGVAYDSAAVASDGFLSFVVGATSSLSNDLDNGSAIRRPLVAPLWDDHDGNANTSAAAYEVTGTAPNRVFTFEWRDWEWSWNSSDSVVSFQVKLYETTNEIEFHYRWECPSCITGPDASIGLSGASSFLSVTDIETGSPTASNTLEDSNIDSVVTDQVFRFTPPACSAPGIPMVTNATTNSIDISWAASGSGPWYVYWGPCGFDQATPGVHLDTVTTTSFSATGLMASSTYEFGVFEDCGANGLSDTTSSGCVNTLCNAFALPFTEGFNSTSGTEFCWTVLDANSDNDKWDMNYGSNAFEGDQSAVLYTDYNAGNNNDWLISPGLIVANNERLKFQYRVQSSNEPNDFMILVSTTGTSPSDFADTLLPLASYSNTTYQQMIIDLSAYSGTIYLAWHVPAGGLDGWRLYIDEVIVETIPACPSSTDLVYTALSSDSIQIAWSPGALAVNHGVEYGPVGFTPGTGTFISTTDTFAVAKPLAADTEYDFYVYDTCSSGSSVALGPETFRTACLPVAIPFTETFNSNSTTQNCWMVLDANNDNDEWDLDYAFNPHSGDQSAVLYTDYNGGNNNDWLISPGLTLTADEELIYYYRVQSSFEPNDFQVLISQTGVAPADFTDTILPLASYSNTTYVEQKIDLSAYSGTCYIAWQVPPGGLDGWRIYIDSVVVQSLPPCPDPTQLTATNIQPNQADLGWTQTGGTAWNIEWGPQGFIQASGTGNIINGVTNPYTLTSLGADSCYDYYVQQDCGASGTSNWVGPFTFCTPPTCPAPTNLGVDPGQITLNSAGVYWTTGGSANWNIEYGPAGFIQGAGSRMQATNDTLVLNNLMSGTEYEFYVRDSCSATDTSAWVGPVSFLTAFATNYLEDFALALPLGWSKADGRLDNSTTFTSTTTSMWGQDNFGNSGSPSHRVNLYMANQFEWAISPSIYIDPSISNLQVEFDVSISVYNSNSQGYLDGTDDTLAVVISTDNGATWSNTNIIWYTDENDTIDVAGEHVIVPLSGYSGYVKFGLYGGSAADDSPDNDLYIDNFEVRTPRACATPTAVTISDIKTDSATVDWTAGTPGFVGATVIYTVGNQPASAGTAVSATTKPVILSGLTSSTGYCVYVVEQCANGYSDTIGPVCFTSQCTAVMAPYFQDFENFTVGHFDGSEGCWDFTSNNPGTTPSGGFSWEVRNSVQTTSSSTGPNGDHTLYPAIGGKWIHSDNSGGSSNDSTMFISPVVDITGLANPELEYWFHNFAATTSAYRQPLYVDLFDGTTWYYKVHVIDSVFQSSGTDAWQDTTLNLAPYSSTGTIQVRFRSQITRSAGGAGDVAIDDVRIANGTSCASPTGVSATVQGCDTVDVSWSSASAATNSYIEYGAKGFTPGSGTVIANVSSPYQLTGLALNTEYDLFVVDSCGMDQSNPSARVSFKTDSVGPVMASFTYTQISTTLTDADVDFDASASTGDGLSYSWDFDGSTGNGVSPQANYTGNGTYNVTLTVTDRCGNTDDTTVAITIVGISIVENEYNASLELYPNPNNGTFKVNVSEGSEFYSLEVVDLSGKVVYQRENLKPGEVHEVNLGNVADGVYMIRFRGEGLSATQRIVVE